MRNVITQLGAALIMCVMFAVPRGTWAQDNKYTPEGHFTMGFMAATTTWDTGFNDLQTPGWPAHLGGHPGGIVDLQYRFHNGTGLFVEAGGDPHRPREATSFSVGLRHDLVRYKRVSFYGQVSIGTFEAPSFLEYCGSYEYRKGDCHASAPHCFTVFHDYEGQPVQVCSPGEDPEYCPWFSVNPGVGVRIQVTKKFAVEPARVEYIAVYGISPRYRFSAGFRVGL